MAAPSWSSVIKNSITNIKNPSSAPNLSACSRPEVRLNESIASKQLTYCSVCEGTPIAESRCQVCKEDLCKDCVFAHQRVKLTRNHLMVDIKLLQSQNEPAESQPSRFDDLAISSTSSKTPSLAPQNHADLLKVYVDAVEKAKAQKPTLTSTAQQGIAQIEEAKGNIKEMEDKINTNCDLVTNLVKTLIQRYSTGLREREKVLLANVEKVRHEKFRILEQQRKRLVNASSVLHEISDQLMAANGKDLELIDACNEAIVKLTNVQANCGSLKVNEDEVIKFWPTDAVMLNKISALGLITGSGFGPNTTAEGEGLRKGILGKDAKFQIIVKDQANQERHEGGDHVMIMVITPDQNTIRYDAIDCNNGTYNAVWKPQIEGEHVISVTVKGVDISGSPFKAQARAGRNYDQIGTPLFEFGGEGEEDGQLCRPWGVCCSLDGLILVANRSNNRIEVYTPKGKFHYKFGESGKLNGQFDRPSSVCCNSRNNVVVADKDNHRIQVFTIEGKFLMMFGERGSKLGQFNYPWDVACNSKDEILVSDTRNHRIQLFSPSGEYLNKYGFEGTMWKHFDSPRGVCFKSGDQPVVTDFNNHRLLVVLADYQQAQFLGKEGSDDGMFTRPNGVAIDEEGHIIVADSRNDRVQIFSSSGVFITKFGKKGAGPGEFDRPSGICISPEGHLIVVDFGNNRVQVF